MIIQNFVALDIETTGFDFEKDEIIEIGAVKYLDNRKTDEFSLFINIGKPIPKFITQLTHITDEMLLTGNDIENSLIQLEKFIEDLPVICHNTSFDIGFIQTKLKKYKLPKLKNKIYDTVELSRIYLPFCKNHKLITVCEYFNISLENAHRAIFDADATAKVFVTLLDLMENQIPLKVNYHLSELAAIADLSTNLSDLLRNVVDQQKKYALLSKKKPTFSFHSQNYIDHQPTIKQEISIDEIFRKNGVLNQNFPNFEFREGQLSMAKAVEHHFQQDEYLLVEAGTGVGKSFAYLIPSIFVSNKKNEKIIISTNTKNLQEQLFFKDLPFIATFLKDSFKAVLLKGRRNYLCEKKWQEKSIDYSSTFTSYEAQTHLNLVVWKEFTKTGDISENSSFNAQRNAAIWKDLSADRHFCQGKKCSFYRRCYLMDIRKKAEKANLVIINHHLLLADLRSENSALGDYHYLVVDEAHNLPRIAPNEMGISLGFADLSTFFSFLFSKRGKFQSGILAKLKSDTVKSHFNEEKQKYLLDIIKKSVKIIEDLKESFTEFFQRINQLVIQKGSYNKLRIKQLENFEELFIQLNEIVKVWSDFSEQIMKLTDQMQGISANVFVDYDTNIDHLDGTLQRINEFHEVFMSIFNAELSDFSLWLSNFHTDDKKYPAGIINYAPLNCQEIFNHTLYSKVSSIIFTSATIAIRGKFKYFSQQMGLDWLDDDLVQELVVPSPFDYSKQSSVLVASMLPAPKDRFFTAQSISLIQHVIELAKTGTMILFTSYRDLNLVYEALYDPFFKKDITLLAQGKGISRTAMIREFRSNKKSVLLGTSSFWEGVDIPGDALSLLILFKLPFLVPTDPIVEAFIEKIEMEGKNSFMHYMMPNALLKYKQGFGRLIRNKTDTGMVIVLDNRIKTKKYGHYFEDIIPAKTHITSSDLELYDHVGRWFNKP